MLIILEPILTTCYICTSNISDSSEQELENCLSPQVDTSLYYQMPNDGGLQFTIIKESGNGTDFSFILPTVADNIFYVDCTVELVIVESYTSSSTLVRL